MAKKILQEEFERRIKEVHPTAKFEILKYTVISKECEIKCLKCGAIKKYQKASNVLKLRFCCEEEDTLEIVKRRVQETGNFHFIKYLKNNEAVISHDECQRSFTRKTSLIIKNPAHCPYCDENTGLKLSFDEAKEQIDKEFNKEILLLEYNAQRTKNTYKCLKCGFIFKQTQKNLLASRGCPKCDRFKSKGERKIKELLEKNNIYYKEQVSFQDLSNGRQKFDFGVYRDKECNQLLYLIECQGEQHYIDKQDIFRDSLEVIQERDKRKRDYCLNKQIPLYEIIYKNGEFINLNILPFN